IAGVNDPDIHDTAISINGAKTVLTSTPREIFASTDGGESWRGLGVGKHFRLPYCRSLALKPDEPGVLFVATGDGALGSTGAIQRSRDGGQSWQALPLPVEPNSPIWSFATHPANPNRILACSHYGEIFASEDAGDSWIKRGDRIGVWWPNNAEWVITQFATAKTGLILVNINPAYRLAELEYALNKAGCAALVTAAQFKTSDYHAMLRELAPELRTASP